MTEQNQTRSITVVSEHDKERQGALGGLKAQGAALIITNDTELAKAADFIKGVKTLYKAMDEDRKKLLAPIKTLTDEINSRYKPNMEMLEQIEKDAKAKALTYQQEQERIRIAAEAAERKRLEDEAIAKAEEMERIAAEEKAAIDAEAAAKAEELRAAGREEDAAKVEEQAETAKAETDAAAEKIVTKQIDATARKFAAPAMVRGSTAGSSLGKRWTYEVTDISKVPAEYLEVKAGALRAKMNEMTRNNGTPEMAGVRFYQEDSISIR